MRSLFNHCLLRAQDPLGTNSSAHGKGHEEGDSAHAKAGSSLRSLPGNSRAIYPQNQSLPTFCFVLSPTPLTLPGAVLGMTRMFLFTTVRGKSV